MQVETLPGRGSPGARRSHRRRSWCRLDRHQRLLQHQAHGQDWQETRINQRKAESYLEVLRLIEVEAQWADAWSTNRKIEAEEPIEGFEGRVPMPDKPPADTKAVIAAHLAAFGSKDGRR